MKYLIYRTSTQRWSDIKPHPLAKKELIRVYRQYDASFRSRPGWKEEFFSKCSEIVEVGDGRWRGIMLCEEWTIDIDDMVSFLDDMDDSIILSKVDLPDIKLGIEIYDDYRE